MQNLNFMREHIRINHTHRDRKPYQCGYCDFRAHTSGNCRKHCVSRHKGTLIKLYPRGHELPISTRKQGQYMTINNLIFRASALSALFERFNGLSHYLWKLILFDCPLLYSDEKISVLKLQFFFWSGLEIKWIKVIDKYDDKSPCLWNTSNVPRLSGKYTFVSLIKTIKLFSRNYLLRCETLLSRSGC